MTDRQHDRVTHGKSALSLRQRLKFEWMMFKEWYFSIPDADTWAKREQARLAGEIVEDMVDRMDMDGENMDEKDEKEIVRMHREKDRERAHKMNVQRLKPMKTHECDSCGLIWRGEMLNLVDRNDDDTIGHHCPNCGGTDVVKRE